MSVCAATPSSPVEAQTGGVAGHLVMIGTQNGAMALNFAA